MFWNLFKRDKPADWKRTGKHRWITVKETPTHILQKEQSEYVDMNSGKIEWQDYYLYGGVRVPNKLSELLIDKRLTDGDYK